MNAHVRTHIYTYAEGWSKFNELNEVDEVSHWSSHAFSFYAGKTVRSYFSSDRYRNVASIVAQERYVHLRPNRSFICLLIKREIKHKCGATGDDETDFFAGKVIWKNGNTYRTVDLVVTGARFILFAPEGLSCIMSTSSLPTTSDTYPDHIVQSR